MGWGQDKLAWTSRPPGVKITMVGVRYPGTACPPEGQAVQGSKINRYTGLIWELGGKTVFMKDTRLPFGASLSPGIFHRLTQAGKRIMARKVLT